LFMVHRNRLSSAFPSRDKDLTRYGFHATWPSDLALRI